MDAQRPNGAPTTRATAFWLHDGEDPTPDDAQRSCARRAYSQVVGHLASAIQHFCDAKRSILSAGLRRPERRRKPRFHDGRNSDRLSIALFSCQLSQYSLPPFGAPLRNYVLTKFSWAVTDADPAIGTWI